MIVRIALLISIVAAGHAGVPAAEPITAERLALRILDGEGLYTVSGGLKPISDGFWQTQFSASKDSSDEVEQARAVLKELPLGAEFTAGVYVFSSAYDGMRSASAFIAHKPSLIALIARRKELFESIGVTVASSPQTVMEKIDRAPRADRWRCFGLIFGYPEYAVEFFVEAGEQQAATKKFVERDFVQLPTFTSDEGRFVYAVPKGHVERDEDRLLKAKTDDLLIRYRAWRAVYIGEGKPGPISLLKTWIALILSAHVSQESIRSSGCLRGIRADPLPRISFSQRKRRRC